MSTIRTFLKTGLLSMLLLGGATLAEAQQNGNQGGQGNGISRQASGSDGSRRNDTNYENLGALCDSLQSALNLTDIDVVPLESSGERKMKRFDEAALRQTLTEMYEALGMEVELPSRFKPSDLNGIFTEILVAAAESTPSVQTIVADGFTTSLAILRGAVTNDGNQALTAWGFKFGTDSDLGDSIHVAFGDYQSFLDTSAQDTGAFMLEKSGLARYTTYYYAAWAENENGIAHGDTLSFMTLPDLADGLALDTSLVTATSATLELAISDAGGQGPDDVGFYWDDVDFTLDAFAGDSLPSDSASGTAHSVQVSGLTRMTTYYFNAYADNLAGRAWADAHFAFTTKPEVPEFDTVYADLTVDSLYALLADDGGQTPTLSRFIYSTTSNAELVTDSVDGVPNGLSFSAPLASASLLPSQDYDLNAFTENSAGRVTAAPASFFTPALAFTGDSVANITDSTASLMASFTFGNRMPDVFGFKWGLAADLSDATVSPVALAADSTIRLDLDGLSTDSTYFYAAYADNGTVQFGDTLSFLAMTVVPPTVLADTAQFIASTRTTLDGSVDFNGGAEVTGFGFIWGTDASLADATEVGGDSTSAAGFAKALLGLDPETTYYYSAFATNAVGTGYSDTLSFTTPGTVTFDGFTYSLVELNGQYWFVESLRNTHFANGDEIPHMPDTDEWSSTFFPGYVNPADDSSKVSDFGRLYNYYAFEDTRGVCPTDWHPATYGDFNHLRITLDLDDAADYRSSAEDSPAWDGTNRTGFSALPAGYRRHTGDYISTEEGANHFWASVSASNSREFRFWEGDDSFRAANGDLEVNPAGLRAGYSIRCVNGAPLGGDLPVVTTYQTSNTTAVSSRLYGQMSDGGTGYVTALGFAYSTDPGLADPQFVARHTTTQLFWLPLEDLEPATTYYYAVFGRNRAGTAYGDTLSFTTGPWECGLPVTYNEVQYETVGLIDECWFAENLATVTFANGDSIPVEASDSLWQRLITPAMTIYGIGEADEATNFETYGAMYNYMVVNDARGVCPTGWHVPASEKWSELKNSLNDPSSADEVIAADAGGTNVTGLSVLLGGTKGGLITYDLTEGETRDYTDRGLGEFTSFWSTYCSYCTDPTLWSLGSGFNSLSPDDLNMGGYIRCMLGDAGPPEVLPAVILEDAAIVESVSANSLTISFEVAENWGAEVYEAGVRVGINRSNTNSVNQLVEDLSGDSYTVTFDSLNPVTTYWYRPYVRTIGGGFSNGYYKTVTTSAGSPVMGTSQVTDITFTGATLNGAVSATGGSDVTSTGFKWATNENMTGATSVNAASTASAFNAQLTGLTASTTYYYQAFATNGIGTSFGPVQSFNTLDPVLPTITTSSATNVDSTTAKIYGLIGFDGGDPVTAAGFVWGANPDLSGATDTLTAWTSGEIRVSLSDLTYNATYYYTAYATNGVGTAYGDTMSFVAVEPPFQCGSSQTISYQGHEYGTIHRGNQCWLTENLQSELFTNGDPIEMVLTGWSSIGNSGTPALTPYDYDTLNVPTYGWLYNWYAVTDPRGLCPTDWHVSEQADWDALTSTLSASTAGASLKAKSSDPVPWNGYNSIGFAAVPAGYRKSDGIYSSLESGAYFWTPDQYSSVSGRHSKLTTGSSTVSDTYYSKKGGMSVRCVKYYPASPPITVSGEYEVLGQTSAQLHGTTLANGGGSISSRGFKYSTDPDLTNPTTRSASGTDDFNATVTGLSIGTTYYYTAYASNPYGTAYGDTLSFTTEDYYPPVTSTVSATVNYTQLILEGSYTNVGGDEITAAGFLYSEDAGLQGATQVNDTSWNATFRQVLDLQPQTTYYFTAFATSSAGTAYGDTLTATTTVEYVPGDSLVFNGNTFSVSKLGNQVWMESNLETETYANGDPIPMLDAAAWGGTTEGAQGWIDDDPAAGAGRGRLYNGYAVMDPRGLCPTGWHVATNVDFTTLLSNTAFIDNGDGTHTYDADFQARIKSSPSDVPSWNGTNTTGLSFLPTGYRWSNGVDYNQTTESRVMVRVDEGINWLTIGEAGGDFNANYATTSINNGGGVVRCVMDPCADENENGVCDFEDVEGCTNNNADNYNPAATVDNGDCVYASFEACGFPFVFNGVGYSTVQIGDQCWFAENLRTSLYADGTAIPDTASDRSGQPYQIEYRNYELNAIFGKAYNLAAVNDPRGLCPTGWEVPSSSQFLELINFVGGSSVAGAALKAAPSDGSRNWNGTNDFGFGALGGGMGYNPGTYVGNFYTYGRFWYRNTNWYDTGYYYEGWTQPAGWSGSTVGGYIKGGQIRMEQGSNSTGNYGESPYVATSVRCICIDSNENGICDLADVYGCMNPDAENFNPAATYEDGSCTFAPQTACGDVLGYNGYGYETVQIGDQCWFAENLRTTEYTDGTAITDFVDTDLTEVALTRGYSDAATTSLYGQLYNGHAVRSDQGLCPSGWHLPSGTEWTELRSFLGSGVDGQKMKSSPEDVPDWDGTNTSGFSALPTGRANEATGYYNMGNAYGYAYYWTADEQSETQQSLVYVRAGNNSASNTYLATSQFASVRCLCDDFNDNGQCDALELQGCTIPGAENYVAGATFDDGSCTFAPFVSCGDAVGFDYHAYETVAIGDQCWFAENLRTTQYADGSDVVIWPSGTGGPSTPAACAYPDPGEQADYGMLYNYYATVHDAGLCPTGWHVPDNSEFETMLSVVGSDSGTKLKASASDEPSWNGTNDYGFSALPGGWSYSSPIEVGTSGQYWTTSTGLSASMPANARMYFFYNDLPAVSPGDNHPAQGRSVRCLKD